MAKVPRHRRPGRPTGLRGVTAGWWLAGELQVSPGQAVLLKAGGGWRRRTPRGRGRAVRRPGRSGQRDDGHPPVGAQALGGGGLQVGHQGHGDLGGVAKSRCLAARPPVTTAAPRPGREWPHPRAGRHPDRRRQASQSRPDQGAWAAPHDLVAEPGPVTVEAGDGDGAEPQVPVAPAASRQLPPGPGPKDQLAACRCARRAGLAIATADRRGHGPRRSGPGPAAAACRPTAEAPGRPAPAGPHHGCAPTHCAARPPPPPPASSAHPAPARQPPGAGG